MLKYQLIFILNFSFSVKTFGLNTYQERDYNLMRPENEITIEEKRKKNASVFNGILGLISATVYFIFTIINYCQALNIDSQYAYYEGVVLTSVNLFLQLFLVFTIIKKEIFFKIINVLGFFYSSFLVTLFIIAVSLFDVTLYRHITGSEFFNNNIYGIWTGISLNFYFTGIAILAAYTKMTMSQIYCLCFICFFI